MSYAQELVEDFTIYIYMQMTIDLIIYAFWLRHWQALVLMKRKSTIMHNELATLKMWNIRNEGGIPLSPERSLWRALVITPAIRRLLDEVSAYRKDASINESSNAKSDRKCLAPR